ncbi:MAG: hypothetical protein HGB19_05675, partial [Chlorobiales bacterium]|nr:hypothetical protein [Chlorobiales bacterium]
MKKNHILYALKRYTPMLFSLKRSFEARPSYPKGLLALLCLALSANLAVAQPFDSNKLERLQNSILSTDGISAVYTEGKTLYTTSYSNGLYILDISNPFAPNAIGRSTEISIPTAGIVKKDNYLFVTDNVSGVIILNVSDPKEPKLVTKLKTASSEGWDLALDKTGNMLFVATGKTGVEIWNISDPEKPVLKTKISGNFKWDYAWSLSYKNDRLYVSDRANGVRIFNVSNPESPQLLNTYATATQNSYVISADTLLFLANGPGGFEVVDISDIDLPRRIFNQSIKSQFVTGLAIYDKNPDYLFVSAGRSGIAVYHIPSILKDKLRKTDKTDNSVPVEFGRIAQSGHVIYVASTRGVHLYNYDLAPFLTKADDQGTDENSPLSYTFEGIDPDGSATAISLTAVGPKPDSLVYNNAARTVKWKPSYEESGIYNFNVQITEQTQDNLSTQQPFRIKVKHVNRPPSIAQLPPQLVQENRELVYQVPAGTDPDREDTDRLTYEAKDLPRGAQFDPIKRTVTWKPDFTQAGDYTTKIIVHDSNSDKKGILSDTTTMSVRVDNVNLAPRFVKVPLQTFKEDSAQSFIIKAIDPDREDSLGLSYTASLLPKGASFDAATQILTWKPDFEQAGSYTAKFIVQDKGLNAKFVPTPGVVLRDTMTVDVAVKQTNRKPKLLPIAAAQNKENTLLTFTISGTDPDKEDAGKLTFSTASLPEGAIFNPETKAFSWTPTFDQSGLHNITFKVTDSGIDDIALSDTQSVAVTIINVNRAPMLVKPAAINSKEDTPLTFEVQATDRDKEDTGKLKVVANGVPEGAKFEGTTLSWIPGYTQAGSYKIHYVVTDVEGLSDSATQVLTITDKNRAPKFKPVSAQRGMENTTLMFTISASDPDEQDAGKIKYSAINPPDGASFDATTQIFSWNPGFTQADEYKLQF